MTEWILGQNLENIEEQATTEETGNLICKQNQPRGMEIDFAEIKLWFMCGVLELCDLCFLNEILEFAVGFNFFKHIDFLWLFGNAEWIIMLR